MKISINIRRYITAGMAAENEINANISGVDIRENDISPNLRGSSAGRSIPDIKEEPSITSNPSCPYPK
ncbi:hypothetical protein GCM10025777_15350 [Membranihabitans marinus]